MRPTLLVVPGHLGKDVGATATLPSDTSPGGPLVDSMQQERWINLQQAVSACVAAAVAPATGVRARLVVPLGVDVHEGGMVDVLRYPRAFFGLEDRVRLANELEADVVEVHNNAAPFAASGFETLCFSRTDAAGAVSESYRLADAIMQQATDRLRVKARGVKPIYDRVQGRYVEREIYILKAVKHTCVITEAGFLTDRGDLSRVDADLDGYNEQVGAAIWLGCLAAYNAARR